MTLEKVFRSWITKVLVLSLLAANAPLWAQSAAQTPPPQPQPSATTGPAVELYRQLVNPQFDPADVYTIRSVSIDREDLHVSLSDGIISLMRAVDGHVTGAGFEGVGEILLIAPTRTERTSLALFTGSAVLEQKFSTAYFRFADDDVLRQLRAGFRQRATDEAQEFVRRWEKPARELARSDGLQLLQALSNSQESAARYMHLRLGGTQLGIFDVYLDTNSQEQISVAQAAMRDKDIFYDVWASFPMRSVRGEGAAETPQRPRFELSNYRLSVNVDPPTDLSATADLDLTPLRSGQRMVILELSRYLRVTEARLDGKPVEFIQNEAISGSDL